MDTLDLNFACCCVRVETNHWAHMIWLLSALFRLLCSAPLPHSAPLCTHLREARKAGRGRREARGGRKVVVRLDAQAVVRPIGGGDQHASGGSVHEIARGRAQFAGRRRRTPGKQEKDK